ncbi:HAD hydrolase-like protein [Streptomyces sp. NPDC005012]|uniref:HAD family hydrolase n=1 Tax=Streptomyces sp. NPDC005012 TaxID=3154558 RepID=UPI0033B300B4
MTLLVLWDIDRTLLYVGDIDRRVYQETFEEVVGRPAENLPARGTGVTMPLAIEGLLRDNGVSERDVPRMTTTMVHILPDRLAAHEDALRSQGILMPGARSALEAVHDRDDMIPTVVTGNLQRSAALKLRAFQLDALVDMEVGGYSSDNAHRPALVAVSQKRAQAKYGHSFSRTNTVIIGDSLEDVRTGLEGGAAVIGVASGKTSSADLTEAGADAVLDDLTDTAGLLAAMDKVMMGTAR